MITTSKTETPTNYEKELSTHSGSDTGAAEFAERVRSSQAKLASELKSHYDFIVCGSGSSWFGRGTASGRECFRHRTAA